jgi:hypothetical protein
MERKVALSSVKERLATLKKQKSLRELTEADTTNRLDELDAEIERKLGIAHLLEIPKINLERVLDE